MKTTLKEVVFFKEVETEQEQKVFEDIWDVMCSKMQFRADAYVSYANRYLIYKNEIDAAGIATNKPIGTVEFIPYEPEVFSTVEGKGGFEFSKLEKIQAYKNQTFEVDKLCIIQEEQGNGHLQKFLYVFQHHQKKYNGKNYISLMNYVFFRAMRQNLGSAILEKVGDYIKRPKTLLVPCIFDVDTVVSQEEKFAWYRDLKQATIA